MRESISPGARLEATLLFLANGGSYSALKFATRISQPSFTVIVPETCEAIYEALKDKYFKVCIIIAKTEFIIEDFFMYQQLYSMIRYIKIIFWEGESKIFLSFFICAQQIIALSRSG